MAPWRQSLPAVSRWMGLVAAIWVQAFAGNGSAYANYSSTLKSVLDISQVQLNYLALSKDFGESFGILAGLICNKVPPWVVLSIAAAEGFFGYGVLWLVTSGKIDPRPLWQMCVAICVGANSTTWFNTAVLVTCMRNFPSNRGTIVGFLKGFIGLSGAIFTQIFNSLLDSNPVKLLLFLAVGPPLVSLFCMGFIRPVKPISSPGILYILEEQKQFQFIYIICIVVAVYLFGAVFVDDLIDNSVVLKVVAGLMLVFLFSPVFVPLRVLIQGLAKVEGGEDVDSINEGFLNSEKQVGMEGKIEGKPELLANPGGKVEKEDEGMSRASLARRKGSWRAQEAAEEEDAETLLALGEGAVRRRKKRPRRGEDFKLRQALVKADFWLLFLTFFTGVGTAITASNNLGQLGQAQGFEDVSIFVLLCSIWGFLGRLAGGWVSELFIRTACIPRPAWMAAAQALMIVAHLLFAFALPGSLYFATSILGLCFGIQVATTVPTISEIFGLKHFGIIYNFITLADPIASLLFSTLLAGSLYDYELARQYSLYVHQTTELVCTGAHCFRLTFLIMAGVCVLGVGMCIILTIRLKPVYVTLYEALDSANASYSSLPSANASSSSLPPVDLH